MTDQEAAALKRVEFWARGVLHGLGTPTPGDPRPLMAPSLSGLFWALADLGALRSKP